MKLYKIVNGKPVGGGASEKEAYFNIGDTISCNQINFFGYKESNNISFQIPLAKPLDSKISSATTEQIVMWYILINGESVISLPPSDVDETTYTIPGSHLFLYCHIIFKTSNILYQKTNGICVVRPGIFKFRFT